MRWLALLALAVLGCKQGAEVAPVARYEAVKATPVPASRWCDASFGGDGPRLSLPPLAPAPGRAQAKLPASKRVWVNLWATWCQPCVRELPLLLKWRDDLRKDGVDVDVLLLSIDDDGEALHKYLGEHKDIAAAQIARVASQREYEDWVKGYVKDPGTPIPLHLLAAGDGHVRCVRGGSLREADYLAARSVFR